MVSTGAAPRVVGSRDRAPVRAHRKQVRDQQQAEAPGDGDQAAGTRGPPAEQVAALTALVQGNDYALLSPVQDLPSPVVASAWGLQLPLEDADDPRLGRFLTKYAQGEQTPEPGAPCIGGTGTPA